MLVGGKIYNTLQAVMTAKVVVVLGFCLVIGVLFVSPANWWNVFSGFAEVRHRARARGRRPRDDGQPLRPPVGRGSLAGRGARQYRGARRRSPATPAAAGWRNSTYSNFVRDKGWGMGSKVGAIPSAIGGATSRSATSARSFRSTPRTSRRWRGWWRYILTDQVLVWAPGLLHGDGAAGLAVARVRALFDAHRPAESSNGRRR